MKTYILCAGFSNPHAGWTAIDELAVLLAEYFDAEILSPILYLQNFIIRERHRYQRLDTKGGDLLIVVARNPGDLAMINAIPNCRKNFARIYAIIIDSYFKDGYGSITSIFDAITVTAHEDKEYPQKRFEIPVHQLYQGVNCLKWFPRKLMHREIDIMAFGRMPASYHQAIAKRFHSPDTPYLYLHSPLGHLDGPEVHLERGMLFKLLQRTSISLAFHMYIEPEGNRPRSMMVTSRWLESLLAGALIAGRRPHSIMAKEMLFWPGATIELPDNQEDSCDKLETILSNAADLQQQRISNISHMLLNHDWRQRIHSFCALTGITAPEKLTSDMSRLAESANYVRAMTDTIRQ